MRHDPYGMGTPGKVKRSQAPRGYVAWTRLARALGIRPRTLALVAAELGIPERYRTAHRRAWLSDRDAARIRAAVALARARRAQGAAVGDSLADALRRDDRE